MFLEEFTLWIYHLRLYPYTELHAGLVGSLGKSLHSAGQLKVVRLPVAQSGLVVISRIFVGKPSVVEQEHVYT